MPTTFSTTALCRTIAAALICAGAAAGALASSTASSAASDSASSTASSASDSLGGSSRASSPGGRTAAGDFRVVQVAALAPDDRRPPRVRLALEPLSGNTSSGPFTLELPQATLAAAGVRAGDVIGALQRPFGVEFTTARPGRPREAFFLVLDDPWQRELATERVGS